MLEKEFGELGPKLQDITKLLKHSNESVLHLLMNLLEIYRYDVAKPLFQYEVVDLSDVIGYSVQELMPLAELKGLQLITDFKMKNARINADPTAMQRVFLNLGNSIKFTPNGGTVDVQIIKNDGHAVVKVRDTGTGISADDQI